MDGALQRIALHDVAAALALVPASAGVGQLLAPEERNLAIGRAANLRRWAASHLGAGPPPQKGRRPPVDLRPVAAALRFVRTGSEFGQRLVFERLMGRCVPFSARRDLKPVAWLHLDPAERFPRVTVRSGRMAREPFALYGPFASARVAARAREVVNKRFQLRPCDYVFEPDPDLELGLGCVYAQTRTCVAPCLCRLNEEDYRRLSAAAAAFLALPAQRGDQDEKTWPWPWVARREQARALVVEAVKGGFEVYPVHQGRVLEHQALRCGEDALQEALAGIRWEAAEPSAEDWPWLAAWLNSPKRRGRYLVIP